MFLLRRLSFLILILLVFTFNLCFGSYRLTPSFGYGGTGISKKESVSGSTINVNRSDQPGSIGVGYEILLADRRSISIDHLRSFSFAPFSSGVGFTGLTWRWYYKNNIPAVSSAHDTTTLLVERKAPFLGLSTGLAYGSISRERDLVETISASSLYYGFRVGYDTQSQSDQGFRVEMFYGRSPPSTGLAETVIAAFSIHACWIFIRQ